MSSEFVYYFYIDNNKNIKYNGTKEKYEKLYDNIKNPWNQTNKYNINYISIPYAKILNKYCKKISKYWMWFRIFNNSIGLSTCSNTCHNVIISYVSLLSSFI